jgi:hypothetical protein
MPGFNANIDGCLSDRDKTVTMNDQERKARILGVQFFDNAPHHAIRHRLIDFIHEPGDFCLSLDTSYDAPEFDHRPDSVARSKVRSADGLIRKLNFDIHAPSFVENAAQVAEFLRHPKDIGIPQIPWLIPVEQMNYPPETGGIKAASSPGRKSSPSARYSQFFATRTEPRSEANDGKSANSRSQKTAWQIPSPSKVTVASAHPAA